jgi:microfibrillar-associated protein 1
MKLKEKLLAQEAEKPKHLTNLGDDDIFGQEDIDIPDVAPEFAMKEQNNESDEEEDEEKLLRPVFVCKDDRFTIKEKLQKELEEKANKELEMKLKEQKKKETKKLVLSYIQKDLNGELDEKDAEEDNMPDDTDEPDNVEEYENWKIRELKRIKRDEEENLKKIKEKEEIERRRNLTDDQRNEENLRLGSDDTLRPFKSKYKFMQKYYTMGVFFKDDSQGNLDHIFNRDYNLPVGEDKFDKSSLPKILQKRRGLFGKRGQTKYTHLTNEDTSCFDPDFKVPENISQRLTSTLGGYKGKNDFDRPGSRKKK